MLIDVNKQIRAGSEYKSYATVVNAVDILTYNKVRKHLEFVFGDDAIRFNVREQLGIEW